MTTEIVLKPEIKVRLITSKGKVWAVAHVITAAGPVTFCAGIDMAKVRAALAKRGGGGVSTGDEDPFFDGAGKLAAKVAKGAALQKVLGQVEEIRKNPTVARAVGLTTVTVPGSGTALAAYESAQATIKALGAQDPATIAKVAQVVKMADAGHPKAITALRVLQVVRQHQKAAEAVLDPSHKQGLVVAYSRELRQTLPPNLLRLLGSALDNAVKLGAVGPKTVVAGWDEDDGSTFTGSWDQAMAVAV